MNLATFFEIRLIKDEGLSLDDSSCTMNKKNNNGKYDSSIVRTALVLH